MNKKSDKSYQDRLKAMKDCIDKNKDILTDDFPDDVTTSGNPELLEKDDDELDSDDNNKDDK